MAITFRDKQEALEYKKAREQLGYVSIIKETSKGNYRVETIAHKAAVSPAVTEAEFIDLGKTAQEKQELRQMVEQEISPEAVDYWHRTVKEQYGEAKDIDKPIEPIIRELNAKGYKTFASCAGHRDKEGYISFYETDREYTEEQKEEIISILEKYGIRNAEFDKQNWWWKSRGVESLRFNRNE